MQPISIDDPRKLLISGAYSTFKSDEQKKTNPCCSGERIKKIAISGIGLAGFIATGSLVAIDLFGNADPKRLAIYSILNGVSVAAILHPPIPADLRKRIYKISSDLSYPLLFIGTELYLNLVPQKNMPLAVSGFIWCLGAFAGKDILYSTSLTVSDFSLSTEPPLDGQELPMIGFSPRNKKYGMMVLPALATAAIAGNVLYQLFKNNFATNFLSDLQKIGLPQDVIALFSGSVLGEGIALFVDTWKEGKETEHAHRLLSSNSLPTQLKVMRVAKTLFIIFAPPVISALLGISLQPNSVEDYISKFAIGSLFGAHQILCRREFTHLQSTLHVRVEDDEERQVKPRSIPVAEKIKAWFKGHWPTVTLLGGLTVYMSWVATTTSSLAIHGGIATMVGSAVIGTGVTTLVGQRFHPGENSRVVNEMAFRLLYSATSFLIVYQYLTTVINIYADDLNKYPAPLYELALLTWGFWGLAVGNNLATIGQKTNNPFAATTHPLTMQELGKTFSLTLSKAQ